jgi:hypothetical protein
MGVDGRRCARMYLLLGSAALHGKRNRCLRTSGGRTLVFGTMVRMVTTCLLASALAALACGCGSGGSSSTTTEAALRTCPPPGPKDSFVAGGWSGKVSGISCGDAGRFIEHHALEDLMPFAKSTKLAAIRASKPGDFSSAGFNCHYAPLRGGHGWHVTCSHAQQTVDFLVTP